MDTNDLSTTIDRLAAAAALLEQAAQRLNEDSEATIGRIVATVESRREAESGSPTSSARWGEELEQKLAAAEQRIAQLEAAGATSLVPAKGGNQEAGRKTFPASMSTLLAKQGVTLDSLEAGAIDAALTSLSIEQRIAVKAQLLRAGLLG